MEALTVRLLEAAISDQAGKSVRKTLAVSQEVKIRTQNFMSDTKLVRETYK